MTAFEGYYLPPYRDLGDYFPAPVTGAPVSHAWMGQASANVMAMFEALNIQHARLNSSFSGVQTYEPTFTGLTHSGLGINSARDAVYLRVGHICTVLLSLTVNAWEDETGFSVPVPAARTNLPLVVGNGVIRRGGQNYAMMGMLDGQTIKFYHPGAGNGGKVGATSPVDPSSSMTFAFQGRYRCEAPPDGYLDDMTRRRVAG